MTTLYKCLKMASRKVLVLCSFIILLTTFSIQCVSKDRTQVSEKIQQSSIVSSSIPKSMFLRLYPGISFDSVKSMAKSIGWAYDTALTKMKDGSFMMIFPTFYLENFDVPLGAVLIFENGKLDYFVLTSYLRIPPNTSATNLNAYNHLVSLFESIYGAPQASVAMRDPWNKDSVSVDTLFYTTWIDTTRKVMQVVKYDARYTLLGFISSDLTDKSLPSARNYLPNGAAIDSSVRRPH